MIRTMTFSLGTLLLLAVTPLHAQQGPDLTIPELTDEQRWARATMNLDAITLAVIAHAKAQGITPEAHGREMGSYFASSWGEPGSGTVEQFVRAMGANYLMWQHARVDLVEQAEGSATMRVNRPWTETMGQGDNYGVTPEEMDDYFGGISQAITSHLGLDYRQSRDGDDLVITVTDRR